MENKEKVTKLFTYIKELYAQKYQVISDISEQEWVKFISDILIDDKNIIVNYMDRTDDEAESDSENIILLQVTKPEFEKPLTLPDELRGWVKNGWDRFDRPLEKVIEKLIEDTEQNTLPKGENAENSRNLFNTEFFDSDNLRIDTFITFNKERNAWVKRQKRINKTRNLFNELHLRHIDLERESETIELMVGQGMLSCKTEDNISIQHPLLLKKVSMQFDALNNIISIIDTNSSPEIYTMLLQKINYINHSTLSEITEQLSKEHYHPLDRNDTPDFLKSTAHRLHVKSVYVENKDTFVQPDEKLIITNNLVFFIRKRTGGVIKAIEDIIEHLGNNDGIPAPLLSLIGENIGIYNEHEELLDINNILSTINGEDKDILLSKEANREQLEIAKRIENYNAVLVQGPPGTGKTHTIANLMGHFLAQGKNVLVASHTKKALLVVKDKMAKGLQNLCVSVLDDNNNDMERSINGIMEYMSLYSPGKLQQSIEELKIQRNGIIADLNDVRKKIFTIKHKEFETFVLEGESFSVSSAAKYVYDNNAKLSNIISGEITIGEAFPITSLDLELIYKTNELISIDDEKQLETCLPDPNKLFSVQKFSDLIAKENSIIKYCNKIVEENNLSLNVDYINCIVTFNDKPLCEDVDCQKLSKLKTYLTETVIKIDDLDDWCAYAILDGKKGGVYKNKWNTLISKIEETHKYASDTVLLLLGKSIDCKYAISAQTISTVEEIKEYIAKGKKLNSFTLFKPKQWKQWKELYNTTTINCLPIDSVNDCDILIKYFTIILKRKEIVNIWKELIEKQGGISISKLSDEPEQLAIDYICRIKTYINWYETVFSNIQQQILENKLNNSIFNNNQSGLSAIDNINTIIRLVYSVLPMYIDILNNVYVNLYNIREEYDNKIAVFSDRNLKFSLVCKELNAAIVSKNISSYNYYYEELSKIYNKYSYLKERKRILSEIKKHAPNWGGMISDREDIHGSGSVPQNIKNAWKWKQLSGMIEEISLMPFEELQHRAVFLSSELKEVTAQLAENLAWKHLFNRVNNDIYQKQALEGWKYTVRKIGKGTGKNAPKLKNKAKSLMARCQSTVPAWIMPINKALESLDPKSNKFDVIIIDEASQSDISALAIIYLAKKIIIVGDDEQVSPSAVGVNTEEMSRLADMYISNNIPNAHLYDMKTSLYDIMKTTFPTLMLKEHFRCVPNIIAYNNRLSYEYKIKPLRDDSCVQVKPATISYRVKDGVRHNNKTNKKEAEAIVALMLACMEFKEYENMTFGVISLLGNEQATKINTLAVEKINPLDFKNRKILCGNASHFQGDERDVIFISLVDSNEEDTPLRLTSEGGEKSTKQRYNVAVSRAKNQLCVVHSLDSSVDLKPGDMRRDLIEFVKNPESAKQQLKEIESKADSPFERDVAKELKRMGYNIIQQWKVGSYSIDMVAVFGSNKIAIECDGERYHSGDEKIRKDMERQAILERLGWRFIRIRGSEYYHNPSETIKCVIGKLTKFGIKPESIIIGFEESSKLKEDVIIRAEQILTKWKEETDNDRMLF